MGKEKSRMTPAQYPCPQCGGTLAPLHLDVQQTPKEMRDTLDTAPAEALEHDYWICNTCHAIFDRRQSFETWYLKKDAVAYHWNEEENNWAAVSWDKIL